jgi:integrase
MKLRAAIIDGRDPAEERQAERGEATFAELAAAYMERHAKPRKKSAWQDENTLRRYIPDGWRRRKLSDIARGDVARLHARVGAEHGEYAANRLLALVRVMFNLARTWGMFAGDNPASGIKAFKERRRERFLSPDELRRVNQALLDEPDWRWRAFFPLALMLGTRRGELLAARWSDIDFDARTWRIPETKAGNSHLLPLPGPALEILNGLPSKGTSEFVFPGAGKSGHLAEPGKAWRRIRERAGVPDVRVHDLRHTLASWLVAEGFGLPLIGKALNHSQVATTARYSHLAIDPVRDALERTAGLMLEAGAK